MRQGAANRISVLHAWRRGGVITTVSSGALLAVGGPRTVSSLWALGIAACVSVSTQVVLLRFLRRCALDPGLAEIPAVARCRRRMCSQRNRRRLAASVQKTARPSRRAQSSEFVLWDRVRLVASELLAMAEELEAADSIDPRTIFDIDRLLRDGRLSPLLNERIPQSEVVSMIRSIRFRIVTAPATRAPVNAVKPTKSPMAILAPRMRIRHR